MPALPPNSLIAVTGITGYIASHVGLAALQAGHRVRGTVRSLERAKTLKAGYIKQGIPASDLDTRLEFVIVDDLLSSDQWRSALEGVDGVVHLALPMDIAGHEFIIIAIESTLSLLRAAKRVASIQRVVVTSSSTAVVTPPMYRDKVLTDEDWNDEAVRIVDNNEPTDQDPVLRRTKLLVYGAGKAKAERAAWDFIEREKPQFDLVATLPNVNFGPLLHGESHSTAGWVAPLLKNNAIVTQVIPAQWFIDVRDDGRLHVLCLTTPSLSGKRIWAASKPFGWNEILTILRKNFPSVQVPDNIEDGEPDRQRIDNGVAKELLGGWIGLEQSIVDLAKSLGY